LKPKLGSAIAASLLLILIMTSYPYVMGKLDLNLSQREIADISKLTRDFQVISAKCQEYVRENLEMTNDINVIIERPMHDLWGSGFYITDYKYVTSAGPDKTKNTKDDINILYFKSNSEIHDEIWNIMKRKR